VIPTLSVATLSAETAANMGVPPFPFLTDTLGLVLLEAMASDAHFACTRTYETGLKQIGVIANDQVAS
jgi:hypothetical protein